MVWCWLFYFVFFFVQSIPEYNTNLKSKQSLDFEMDYFVSIFFTLLVKQLKKMDAEALVKIFFKSLKSDFEKKKMTSRFDVYTCRST